MEDAHTYFMDVFAEKRANASVLGEGLNTFVPTGEDHENTEDLYSEIWESEVAASDEVVAKIAREELKTFVRRTAQSNPTAELITKYLSADKDPRLDKLNYSTHSSLLSRI